MARGEGMLCSADQQAALGPAPRTVTLSGSALSGSGAPLAAAAAKAAAGGGGGAGEDADGGARRRSAKAAAGGGSVSSSPRSVRALSSN